MSLNKFYDSHSSSFSVSIVGCTYHTVFDFYHMYYTTPSNVIVI